MILSFTVNGDNIVRSGANITEKIASRSIGVIQCKFDFDAAWDAFDVRHLFAANASIEGHVETPILDSSGQAFLSETALSVPGRLMIGAYSSDGTNRIVSELLTVDIVPGAYGVPNVPDPPLSVYEQIMEDLQRALNLADSAANHAANLDLRIGDLSELTTDDKSTLVGAINEVRTAIVESILMQDLVLHVTQDPPSVYDPGALLFPDFVSAIACIPKNLNGHSVKIYQEAGNRSPGDALHISGFTGGEIMIEFAEDALEEAYLFDDVCIADAQVRCKHGFVTRYIIVGDGGRLICEGAIGFPEDSAMQDFNTEAFIVVQDGGEFTCNGNTINVGYGRVGQYEYLPSHFFQYGLIACNLGRAFVKLTNFFAGADVEAAEIGSIPSFRAISGGVIAYGTDNSPNYYPNTTDSGGRIYKGAQENKVLQYVPVYTNPSPPGSYSLAPNSAIDLAVSNFGRDMINAAAYNPRHAIFLYSWSIRCPPWLQLRSYSGYDTYTIGVLFGEYTQPQLDGMESVDDASAGWEGFTLTFDGETVRLTGRNGLSFALTGMYGGSNGIDSACYLYNPKPFTTPAEIDYIELVKIYAG